jgi:hypothetical protein
LRKKSMLLADFRRLVVREHAVLEMLADSD